MNHHPKGMSRWPSILACGRFEGREGNADAEVGTSKHAKLAELLNHLKVYGALPPREDGDYLDAGVYRAAEMIRDCMIATNVAHGDLHIEERVTLNDGVFGTADVWYENVGRRELFVWDFKTFRNAGRDYTAQLAGYALAIYEALERDTAYMAPSAKWYLPEVFHLRVIYGDSREIDSVTLGLDEIKAYRDEAMDAFDNVPVAQPTQCNWCELCANYEGCQAVAAVAKRVMDDNRLASTVERWDDLTPAVKAQRMIVAQSLSKWCDAVLSRGKADMVAGVEIEDEAHGIHPRLQSQRGRKTVRVPDLCAKARSMGIEDKDITPLFEVKATAVERLFRTVGLKGKALQDAVESVCDFGPDVTKLVL